MRHFGRIVHYGTTHHIARYGAIACTGSLTTGGAWSRAARDAANGTSTGYFGFPCLSPANRLHRQTDRWIHRPVRGGDFVVRFTGFTPDAGEIKAAKQRALLDALVPKGSSPGKALGGGPRRPARAQLFPVKQTQVYANKGPGLRVQHHPAHLRRPVALIS
jgi:hypothetical protein